MSDVIEDKYGGQIDRMQSKLEAFEGHGPPSDDELIGVAHHETGGAIGVIESIESGDGEFLEENLQTLKTDILKIRAALEMVNND